jgi:hypothetical protein
MILNDYSIIISVQTSCAMVGTVLMVFCRCSKFDLFRNIQTGIVARGIGNGKHVVVTRTGAEACYVFSVLGNKGAVCVRFDIADTSVCIVNAHLSAHREAVQKRNDDYAGTIRNLLYISHTNENTLQF